MDKSSDEFGLMQQWQDSIYDEALAMTKYRAIRTNGYASKAEARRAGELKLLQAAHEISNLEEQVSFTLLPAVPEKGIQRPLRYIADFMYTDEFGRKVIEDVKGMETPVYKIKKRLMYQILGLKITEVK